MLIKIRGLNNMATFGDAERNIQRLLAIGQSFVLSGVDYIIRKSGKPTGWSDHVGIVVSCDGSTIFKKFAIATKDLETVNIAWTGNDVFIQKEAVVDDYGIFSSPDILFSKHTQNMSKIKLYLYSHIGTKMMTKRVFKIRNSKK